MLNGNVTPSRYVVNNTYSLSNRSTICFFFQKGDFSFLGKEGMMGRIWKIIALSHGRKFASECEPWHCRTETGIDIVINFHFVMWRQFISWHHWKSSLEKREWTRWIQWIRVNLQSITRLTFPLHSDAPVFNHLKQFYLPIAQISIEAEIDKIGTRKSFPLRWSGSVSHNGFGRKEGNLPTTIIILRHFHWLAQF